LIDDEADILTLFKRSLEISGYSTYGFMNPIAAVEHFKQNPNSYQVVITDVRMPGMSGFEVVRAVRKFNPAVKIIMTSSFEMSMKEMKTVMPSLKIDGVIEKPIELEKLNEIIRKLQK
jgi:CheY-like chemotaxis protein